MTNRWLLIDDDPDFVSAFIKAIEQRGEVAMGADSINMALGLLQEHPFTRCVLDLRIGPTSGLSAIGPLLAIQPSLPIVLLTGYASIATAVDAIKQGAIHYLIKPASLDRICQAFLADAPHPTPPPYGNSYEQSELETIQQALISTRFNITKAAHLLGISRRTIQRKLSKQSVSWGEGLGNGDHQQV